MVGYNSDCSRANTRLIGLCHLCQRIQAVVCDQSIWGFPSQSNTSGPIQAHVRTAAVAEAATVMYDCKLRGMFAGSEY